MENRNDFALFIEELRKSRNIPREEFVDGIISTRQYYRFIKGESSLRHTSINELLDRLSINSFEAYDKFKHEKDDIRNKLRKVYVELYLGNIDEAQEIFKTIKPSSVTTEFNKQYYTYLSVNLQVKLELLDAEVGVERIRKLIDYPNILKKDMLSFVELACLVYIQSPLASKGDYRIAQYTYEMLKKEKRFTKEYRDFRLALQHMTMKSLGHIKEFDKSLEIANQSIKEYEVENAINLYASSIYYKALNEKNLYNDERYKDTLIKLFSLFKAQDNSNFSVQMRPLIKRAFNIEESDLILYKTKK